MTKNNYRVFSFRSTAGSDALNLYAENISLRKAERKAQRIFKRMCKEERSSTESSLFDGFCVRAMCPVDHEAARYARVTNGIYFGAIVQQITPEDKGFSSIGGGYNA